jgi:hypothetical protein
MHPAVTNFRQGFPGGRNLEYFISSTNGTFIYFQRKAKVTDDDIRKFMDPTRKILPKFGKSKTQG